MEEFGLGDESSSEDAMDCHPTVFDCEMYDKYDLYDTEPRRLVTPSLAKGVTFNLERSFHF